MAETPRILQIRQDNEKRQLQLHRITPTAMSWLGYSDKPITGTPFDALLAPEISRDIADDITYDVGGVDIAELLKRYRELSFRHASGAIITSRAEVSFAGMDGMALLYNIRLDEVDRVERSRRASSKLADRMRHKAPDALDPACRLPDKESFRRDIILTIELMRELSSPAYLLVIAPINVPDKMKALHTLGLASRQCFRATDTVARAGENLLGVILMDSNAENAEKSIGRLITGLGKEIMAHCWLAGTALQLTDDGETWSAALRHITPTQAINGQLKDLRPAYFSVVGTA